MFNDILVSLQMKRTHSEQVFRFQIARLLPQTFRKQLDSFIKFAVFHAFLTLVDYFESYAVISMLFITILNAQTVVKNRLIQI